MYQKIGSRKQNIFLKFPRFETGIKSYQHSDLQYSEDIAEFLANFLRRIVKKTGQKLILGFNFINKNSDDFYVL